jgi:pyruvate ferredoxin oxidoreductase gamma subunit
MLEIRWHSRAGQGAVTGAKGFAEVVSNTGKEVQAFAFYGSAKRGAAMTAYNRVDDKQIINNEKYMEPDYVLVLDPALVMSDSIILNHKESTIYILGTNLSKDEVLEKSPFLKGKNIHTIDCIKIAQETIGRAIPNTPMLGAFMKISGMLPIDEFKEDMKLSLKKFPQKIIDANMDAISQAYNKAI